MNKRYFHDVERFCVFIGYPGSGHTLIGSLLDAHPNAIIADECNVLKYVDAGFSRQQIFYLLSRNSQLAAAAGRKRAGYFYHVPGQWQGRFQKLRLIGDKKAGAFSYRMTAQPPLLERLQRLVNVEITFIHVIRNPYDIISTLSLRSGAPLAVSVKNFFTRCGRVESIKRRVKPTDVYDLRHEDFLRSPKAGLRDLGNFLNLPADEKFFDACASIVFQSAHQSRFDAPWNQALIDTVKQNMARHEFLDAYGYDEP